ncbi:hypothetical protein I7I50_04874 [Histoplasma capsulatum G186AR]|uniref:Uncharacterized protein n=1 Tax=Ajellomyces capsulatus TaxID=5037 RepID=A0A8H7ZBT3_AJECA|nr:hypothetical protein I7I52_03132 [Histoplasma capsulatum]QSS75668.1 hypothetical protein I7I50_04874 [Histoplasma capsulatum G186AR]
MPCSQRSNESRRIKILLATWHQNPDRGDSYFLVCKFLCPGRHNAVLLWRSAITLSHPTLPTTGVHLCLCQGTGRKVLRS